MSLSNNGQTMLEYVNDTLKNSSIGCLTDSRQFNASTETRTPVELAVQGKIPACVAGTLYRTGPGHYKLDGTPVGEYKISHWFGQK